MDTNNQGYKGDFEGANANGVSANETSSGYSSIDNLDKIRRRQRGKAVRGRAAATKEAAPRKKIRKNRSLFMEYVCHWYIILLSFIMCFPAYMAEAFLGSLFIAKGITPFWSALLTMFVGGFIATFPFLILNIVLVVRKKYYAIPVQIIVMELLGLSFYLYHKMAIMFV